MFLNRAGAVWGWGVATSKRRALTVMGILLSVSFENFISGVHVSGTLPTRETLQDAYFFLHTTIEEGLNHF